jgi:hypothetical protein
MARKRDSNVDLRPGNPAGDQYLTQKANERRKRGFVGFTRKGRGADATAQFGSRLQKSGYGQGKKRSK